MTEMAMAFDLAMLFSNMMAACRGQGWDAMSEPWLWWMRDAPMVQPMNAILDGVCCELSGTAVA